ncbi:TMV resistance protein N-like isoform X3 [Punica granatum]|nr:TMV resistance protein N-like isoform X2 [Punica granatum]XP_031372900.1 TMV resistance protein N-like isoform X2 [Punica granatum]XP_031372901.1 TMV resistance protein N-like isoform X2 [Punica granatum]XP_031372902.1 TMV resistance protein N-like isoform X3 [Punica granatum]
MGQGYGEFARSFAREVSMKLKVKHKCVTDYLVQRDDQVEGLMELLDIESTEVRFVGIHGMGGIGKTTLAKLVFNKLLGRFEKCSFLADVRSKGIELLQKQLLDNLGLGSGEIMDVDDGIIRMRERLAHKKVLIVLDDVDHRNQIQKLAGDASWFGSGSRILITTRDQRVVQRFHILEVEEMKPEEALRLFSMHAFEKDSPPNGDYLRLAKEAIKSSGRLPLALEVIGSFLRDKRPKEWVDTINRLERVPHPDVQEKLKISYDALDDRTKQIFLDIACFFIDHDKRYPSYMWEACDFEPKMELKVFVHLSMVKIIKYFGMKKLWMHDQLWDLGRKIITNESLKDIVRRSRLWRPEDALKVLQQDEDKPNIEMLRVRSFDYSEDAGDGYILTQKELSSLRSLRYLECSGANFSGRLEHLLPKLMWLSWRRCPEKFMGTGLCLGNLVILDLSCSSISETWGGWNQIGTGNSLKVLDLRNCHCLTKTPDLSKYSTLERLILCQCTNLVEIHPSIGKLRCLKELDLEFCFSLEGLPEELCCPELIDIDTAKLPQRIGRLGKLEILNLYKCRSLEEISDSLGNLRSLSDLDMLGTRITELPDTIGNLKKLARLDLSETRITELPDSIGNLKKLRVIKMAGIEIKELPSSIGMLKRLEVLDAERCESLAKIPSTIGGLTCLRVLNLKETSVCRLPPKLPTSLIELHVSSISLPRLYPSGQIRPSKLRGVAKLHKIADLTLDIHMMKLPR